MMTTFVDTHAHLYDDGYKGILDKVLENAKMMGVIMVFCVSEDIATSLRTLRISDEFSGCVYPLIGIHPWTASHHPVDHEAFHSLVSRYKGKILGIGEIGLDRKYVKHDDEWRRQYDVFKGMLSLAEKHNLPIQVHSRSSASDVLETVLTYNVRMVQFHWYSDAPEVLNRIVDNGFYVSFTPSLTYSKRIKRLASMVPPTQILSETDSPVPFYGAYKNKLTEPRMVVDVVNTLADIHGMSIEDMAERIILNLNNLYKINIT